MPIMKYRCQDCGKEFSKIFFSEDQVPKNCPVCGAPNIEEAGHTFKVDNDLAKSVLCVSCESCSDESCGSVRSSS